MSDKRFVIDEETNYKDYPIILDTKTGDWWVIQDTMIGTEKLLDLLNKQQDTIAGLILDRNRQEEKLDIARRNLSKQLEKIDEQQSTISALKDIFKDIITYSEWDTKKPYGSLRIAVDRKTYYKIREILNEH